MLERARSRSQHMTCDRFLYRDPAQNRLRLSLGGQWRHVLALSGRLGKPDAVLQTKARVPAISKGIFTTQNELCPFAVLCWSQMPHKHPNRNVLMGRKKTQGTLQTICRSCLKWERVTGLWHCACFKVGTRKKELSCHVKTSSCVKKTKTCHISVK